LLWVALAAAVVVLGLLTAMGRWLTLATPTPPVDNPLANATFSRFTNWPGTEGAAEISPDGKFVAFLADKAGQFDIWLSQVGTGNFVNLTQDVPPLTGPRSDRLLRNLGFSGDGAEIWSSLARNPGERTMLMPLTGGAPRAFLGDRDTSPSWSPDGTRLVYLNIKNGDRMFVASRAGVDARQIVVPQEGLHDAGHNHHPVWSPDGEWIYFAHGDPTVAMDLWRVRPSGESAERLTEQHTDVNFLAPIDKRTLLYVAHADDRQGPWLWAFDLVTRATRRVSSGLEQYTSVSASRDGRRVVATVANPTSTLWRVPLLDRLTDDRDAQPYDVPMVRALSPRFRGTSLFCLSTRTAADGLWRVADGQAFEVWKGVDGALSEPPAVSPDGRRVAVVVTQQGRRHLAIMPTDGTSVRTLAASIDIEGVPGQGAADWSPDGAWIVTGGRDAQGPALFKIPVDGGSPVRLVDRRAVNPIWSPDGNLILYVGAFEASAPLFGVRPDGTPVELPNQRVRPGGYRFLPGGTSLAFLPTIDSLDFWLLHFASKSTRQLTRLTDQGALRTFDITPDGKHIVFDRSRENSDIVLIDLPK